VIVNLDQYKVNFESKSTHNSPKFQRIKPSLTFINKLATVSGRGNGVTHRYHGHLHILTLLNILMKKVTAPTMLVVSSIY